MADKSSSKSKVWVFVVVGLAVVIVAVVLVVGRRPGGGTAATQSEGLGATVKLDAAAVDAIIPPLPEAVRSDIITPNWSTFADRLRGIYAALPAAAKQQMQTKGEYAFHLADAPKEQADIIREIVEGDRNLKGTLEGWVGKPLDLRKFTILFQRQGDFVALRFRAANGNEANWAAFGRWAGK